MNYNYADLSPTQFEHLVIHLCGELFGIGAETFSDGPDGGRDSRFEGMAQLYPSMARPWDGLTVIQAKHTISYNSKFSDPDFFSPDSESATITLEVKKIKKLIDEDGLNNYIIFSNRKLPANINEKIKKYLSQETGLPKENIGLIGTEAMGLLFKRFPHIAKAVDLNPYDVPLSIQPDDLADVIVSIKDALPAIKKKNIEPNLKRTDFSKKNELNSLTNGYAGAILKKMGDFYAIESFLSMPDNEEHQQKYIETADELHAKICIYKKDHHSFDQVIEKTIELIIDRDNDCRRNKALTRAMVYYMYYKCDIGENYVA
ncbi:restriction endonuclease [Vibrio sp. ZSDZ65]|uniref:Restriction endonuclease n=1 Tax=Vibrio qingdaonensis TaxID=2829491 RepID=A0A9X3CT84_9VIBR|nr:ABC-three component system protein [Vibrio qingdaonensis]MCW8348993.1 restriction endonuclease [Vibrio qingdaonensis]